MSDYLFPYPGGKSRYADWICRHFAAHECYVEAFGGSAAVLLNKPRSPIEVYNDKNGEVWHFFKIYTERGDELVDRLEDLFYSAHQFEEWADDIPDDPIDRAARFFFMRYAKFGSVLGPSGFSRMNIRNVANQFEQAVADLPNHRDRLRGVTLDNLDWSDCVDKYDGEDTLFYFDPPYLVVGDDIYDLDSGFDHEAFVDRLHTIDGKWVVSYDELPDGLDDYYTVERETANKVKYQSSGNERSERLVMNYDPGEVESFRGVGRSGLSDFA